MAGLRNVLGIGSGVRQTEDSLLRSRDFSGVWMQGMLSLSLSLSLLLFACALHVDLSGIKAYRWRVGALAVLSTVLSTAAVGYGAWLALR